MTALSGVAGSWPRATLRSLCANSIDQQTLYSRDRPLFLEADRACVGAALFPTSSRDTPNAAVAQASGFLLVADARIDNLSELAGALADRTLSDKPANSELLIAGWRQWREALFTKLVGSFAFAIYDESQRRLLLARSPTFDRPLCYRIMPQGIRFASMPSGLFGDEGFNPDLDALANLIVRRDVLEGQTCFAGIRQVPAGHFLEWHDGKVRTVRFWSPPEVQDEAVRDPFEQFRELLTAAVNCRLDRISGRVASHLSGGLDSSAVTALAAKASGERRSILAYTAVPRPGAALLVPSGRYGDESAIASKTAEFLGIEHHLVTAPRTLLECLDGHARFYQAPVPNVTNHGWGEAIDSHAASAGATVLLSATRGNATISAGNVDLLSEWLRRGWLVDYLRQIRRLTKNGEARWRGAIFYSIDEFMPKFLWGWLAGKMRDSAKRLFVHPDLYARSNKQRPAPATLGRRVRRIQFTPFASGDSGIFTKGVLAKSGLDERDPGGDTRLAEFCLSLPPQYLIGDGQTRRLIRTGLRGIVPDWVLEQRHRGYQGADWFARFEQQQARDILDEISASSVVSDILDIGGMRRAIDSADTMANHAKPVALRAWAQRLTRALAVGSFIRECETGFARIGRR